ncbi:MAG: 5'-methylthioadenosine/adenosylhomocysteine nucleosidase [Clostridia bacterium]|nr:5'-methylthioadenosine/adenosylhomocysteine nucleosidase [Clostridia bacterium]
MLGIIGAMDKEVDALREQMEGAREETIGFTRYTCGTLWGAEVCLARCGIGKVHAALCAQGMILSLGAERMLNIGVAGALRDSLQIGDIVIADSAVQHDVDTTPLGDPLGMISGPDIVHIPCDEAMKEKIRLAAEEAALRYETGAIATGDQFIVGTEKKDFLARQFDAAACDMEGGAIAQCCYEMRVPYAAVRAISDTRLGDETEYALKADLACRNEEKLLKCLIELLRTEGECQHG